MPIPPANFPALTELSNGEDAISTVFNRPLFALSTRTESLKTLLESVEGEVVDARGGYPTLQNRLDTLFGTANTDRNIFIDGGLATWNATASSFTFTTLTLIQPELSYNYTISGTTIASIADGNCLYVTLSRNPASTTLTIVKAASGAVPVSENTYVLAVRKGNRLWLRGFGEFEESETREIGDGPTAALLGRLGMTSESDEDSHFSNTTIISIGDNIPQAISKFDLELEYQIRDRNTIMHSDGNVSWNGTNLVLAENLVVTVPSVGDVTVNATTVSSVADKQVVYMTFVRTGSDYVATLNKVNAPSLPLSNGNTDHYVIGYRDGTRFVFRTGDVFQSGETKLLGAGGGGLIPYQNNSLFPSSDDDITWDATSGSITCLGDITIHFPWATYSNVIKAAQFPLTLSANGKKAYVELDRSKQKDLTVIDDADTMPLTYSNPDMLLVAERVGTAMYLFGTHRFNDQDIRRVGEGFVAGVIYDEQYLISGSESVITLPNGGEHADDDKTLKVWGNGKFLYPGIAYEEGPLPTQIQAKVSEEFPDGNFTDGMLLRMRIESIVTGGAGAVGGGGDDWFDPLDSDIVPDNDNSRSIGGPIKGIKKYYFSDQQGNGDVFEVFVDSGSLQVVKV